MKKEVSGPNWKRNHRISKWESIENVVMASSLHIANQVKIEMKITSIAKKINSSWLKVVESKSAQININWNYWVHRFALTTYKLQLHNKFFSFFFPFSYSPQVQLELLIIFIKRIQIYLLCWLLRIKFPLKFNARIRFLLELKA